jgi:hypothetical protein
MKALSATAVPAEYKALDGKEATLGKLTVTVNTYEKESQSGSWERGFKWSHSVYGYLTRTLKTSRGGRPLVRYSPDHGATWYEDSREMKKQRAGKVLVSRAKSQEFAFEAIQATNRKYEGPGYKWKP